MRVGIDLGGSHGGHEERGIGVHTNELFNALKSLKSKEVEISEYKPGNKYDLVHYTVFKPFSFSLPFKKPAKKVVLTIHDFIPLIYPKHYPSGIKGKIIFLIQKYLIKKNVDAIITISETSKKDICRFLGVSPEKVYVIYLAPKKIFKKIEDEKVKREIIEKYDLPKKFVLYVGDVNYNKNIPNLIKAAKLAKLPLVICGKQAKEIETKDLNHPELLHLKNIDWSGVLRLGFVSDEDLGVIYNLATVYCQPSLYEGFGLPVLEALSCGCPVVASKTQALIEIAEDLGVFVDPKDPMDIAKGINNFVRPSKPPREYSWEKTAKETRSLYEKI